MRKLLITGIALFLGKPGVLFAQSMADFDFGDVDAAVFNIPDTGYLAGAGAVYIADIGRSEYVTHSSGKFTVEFRSHVRIKINDNNGFDAANFSIPLFKRAGHTESITELEAVTYNLENGVVTKTKLEPDQIFSDQKNKRVVVKKFAMPAVRAGSIIDVEYNVSSDFTGNINQWYFQGKYPTMRSDYTVLIPAGFGFTISKQTNFLKSIDTSMRVPFSYTDGQNMGFNNASYDLMHWSFRKVPGLKLEPFTTVLENHLANVTFNKSLSDSWSTVTKNLLGSEYFGAPVYEKNNWLNDELKSIVAGITDDLEKTKKIYAFVRDNFRCTDAYETFLTDGDLRSVFKKRSGTAADVNLLLIAMLYHAKIDASPMLIRTTELTRRSDQFPVIEDFNLTVAACLIAGEIYYLDASNPMLAFGKLSGNCYNGNARIIKGTSIPVTFIPDRLNEKKLSQVSLNIADNGDLKCSYKITLGDNESVSIRKLLKDTTQEKAISQIGTLPANAVLANIVFENENVKDEPLRLSYDLTLSRDDKEGEIYIEPFIGATYTQNPFKSSERLYAVEMPYKIEKSYDSEILIPKGYKVDEVPKALQTLLNGGDGMFEYLVTVKDDKVVINSKVKLSKATFPATDYPLLRDFYDDIVKKHSEQIVFKKIN